METLNVVIKIIALIVIATGIVMIFDARKISKKLFGFNDQNSSVRILKIVGFLIAIVGGIVIILNS